MTKKSIPIKKVRNWPVSKIVSGQKFETRQGQIQIHTLAKGDIWVVSNIESIDGNKPARMPKGFRYGYWLGNAKSRVTFDLTCDGALTGFKETVEKAKKMQFVGEFSVSGKSILLSALKEEAVELGWQFSGEITPKTSILIFDKGEIKAGDKGTAYFQVPYEWDVCIEMIKEQEEVEEVEYLRCIYASGYADGFCEDRIYKRDASLEEDDKEYYVLQNDMGEWIAYYKNHFVPATEDEFFDQGPNIQAVGGFKINIKNVKINGYETMKMACIGCARSEQVYSLGALKTLYDVMCDSKGTFNEEGVTFTKEQVEVLIEVLSS